MNFDYTEEFENYFLVLFNINNIPFSAIVDKETHNVIDIVTLKNGMDNSEHSYDKDTSMKTMTWLPVSYFEVEDVIKKYFNENY